MDLSSFNAAEWLQLFYYGSAVMFLLLGVVGMNVKLPDFMWRMLVYGKLVDRADKTKRGQSEATKARSSLLQVPKSWFLHYYIVATLADGYGLWIVLSDECYSFSQVLLGVLLLVNSVRRLQESLFVCVFSNATMHIAHYVLGVGYYLARNYLAQYALTTYYEQSVDQTQRSPLGALYSDTCWSASCCDWFVCVLLVVCVYGMLMQHRSLVELANLRNDPSLRNKHVIPRGSTFKYVSCPHYFWELVIYTCFQLMITHFVHTPLNAFLSVYVLVIVNQTVSAVETHRWYLSRFSDYPKERKAIIPFLF